MIWVNSTWLAYFLKEKIPAKTKYETHNGEPLAIIKDFKTWQYYLKGYKHEIFVLTNLNNLCWFIDAKSWSSQQICWTQKFFKYHFQIKYHQNKANGVANTLFHFSQKSHNKEKKL